jgi:hypothetical protein
MTNRFTIVLPPNTHTIPVQEIPLRIGCALHGEDEMHEVAAATIHKGELDQAISTGEITPRSRLTNLPVKSGVGLRDAVVSIEDLRIYVARFEIAVIVAAPDDLNETIEQTENKPLSRHRAQENAILKWLKDNKYDSKRLPKQEPGKAWVPSLIRKDLLKRKDLFVSRNAFNKAWDRLRESGEIAQV